MGTVEAKTFLYCWRRRWKFARAEGVGLPEGAARAAKRSQEAERVEGETRPAYASPPTSQTPTPKKEAKTMTAKDMKAKPIVEVA